MRKLDPTRLCLPLLLLGVLLLTACAPPVQPRQRFFWPPGVDRAKLEYIDFYYSDQDLRKKHSLFADIVFGQDLPTPLFARPTGIASDGQGRVLVTDSVQQKVLILDLLQGTTRALADPKGGDYLFKLPYALAVNASGQVFVSDALDKKILIFGPDEKYLRAVGQHSLQRPTGLAVDSNRQRIYVVDTGSHSIAVFDHAGELERQIGRRGSSPGEFNFPVDVDLDADGNLYVLDALNARVQVFTPEGDFLRQFGERGTAPGSFQMAKGLAVSPSGQVYVTDALGHKIVIFDLEGNYLLTVGGRSLLVAGKISPGGLNMPQGIDVDQGEAIWVIDGLNRMVHQFQYLNEAYLGRHPIRPEEVYLPPGMAPGGEVKLFQ